MLWNRGRTQALEIPDHEHGRRIALDDHRRKSILRKKIPLRRNLPVLGRRFLADVADAIIRIVPCGVDEIAPRWRREDPDDVPGRLAETRRDSQDSMPREQRSSACALPSGVARIGKWSGSNASSPLVSESRRHGAIIAGIVLHFLKARADRPSAPIPGRGCTWRNGWSVSASRHARPGRCAACGPAHDDDQRPVCEKADHVRAHLLPLREQLESMTVTESKSRGLLRFEGGGKSGAGAHSDLVFALALACEALQGTLGQMMLPQEFRSCWRAATVPMNPLTCYLYGWQHAGRLRRPILQGLHRTQLCAGEYQKHLEAGGEAIGLRSYRARYILDNEMIAMVRANQWANSQGI